VEEEVELSVVDEDVELEAVVVLTSVELPLKESDSVEDVVASEVALEPGVVLVSDRLPLEGLGDVEELSDCDRLVVVPVTDVCMTH